MKIKKIYSYPSLHRFPRLVAATSTVDWGDLSGRTPNSRAAQADFFHFLELTGKPVFAEQTHGNKVVRVVKKQTGQIMSKVDGLVTVDPGVVIAVKTADCLPVLAYDSTKETLGLAHAGWRGIKKGVVFNLIKVMQEVGSRPADLRVCLGPHLQVCCCEFCSPQLEEFAGAFPGYKNLVVNKNGRRFLNIAAAVQGQLRQVGVRTGNIWTSPVCTFCGQGFYSARSQKKDLKETLTVGMIREDGS